MLTVLIETWNDEDALARTLATLVSGAVEGIVRDVIVHDRGSTDQTAAVADHAGCVFLRDGGLSSAIGRAKGDWLLLLPPGARLDSNWIEAVLFHTTSRDGPARFSRLGATWFSGFARLFTRKDALADGFLIRKSEALARARGAENLQAVVRGLSGKRLAAVISASN